MERRTLLGGIIAPSVSVLSQGSLSIFDSSQVENAWEYENTIKDGDKETKQRLYLEEETRAEFGEIVGEGPALKSALNLVSLVAPTDSSVLILGETGTGKELIARAIHNLSSRRERAFVKLNCAAIPLGLLERKRDALSLRTKVRSFLMRSATFLSNFRRNCYGSCKSRNSRGLAATARTKLMSA